MKKFVLIISLFVSSIFANNNTLNEQKLCEKGDFLACERVGFSYESGKFEDTFDEKKVDIDKAIYFYNIACIGDIKTSCAAIAEIYKIKAFEYQDKYISYNEKACKLKNSWACNELGNFYDSIKNFKKAKDYYEKACNLKNEASCYELGVYYKMGTGVTQNIDKAISIFTFTCNGVEEYSCKELGELLIEKNNLKDGTFYMSKACKSGNNDACKKIDKMKKDGLITIKNSNITNLKVWSISQDNQSLIVDINDPKTLKDAAIFLDDKVEILFEVSPDFRYILDVTIDGKNKKWLYSIDGNLKENQQIFRLGDFIGFNKFIGIY
ncbi:MAG: tetratricopeptide repeat protein [Campylobacteraceae bacterium]